MHTTQPRRIGQTLPHARTHVRQMYKRRSYLKQRSPSPISCLASLLSHRRRVGRRTHTQRPLLGDLLDKVVAILLDDPTIRCAETVRQVLDCQRKRVLLYRVEDQAVEDGDRMRAGGAVL